LQPARFLSRLARQSVGARLPIAQKPITSDSGHGFFPFDSSARPRLKRDVSSH